MVDSIKAGRGVVCVALGVLALTCVYDAYGCSGSALFTGNYAGGSGGAMYFYQSTTSTAPSVAVVFSG